MFKFIGNATQREVKLVEKNINEPILEGQAVSIASDTGIAHRSLRTGMPVVGIAVADSPIGNDTVQIDCSTKSLYLGDINSSFTIDYRDKVGGVTWRKASLQTGFINDAVATWIGLTNTGKFKVTVDGVEYTVNPDFTGDTTMDEVATSIQVALRTATSGTETVTYDSETKTFIITSNDDTPTSEVSFLSPGDDGVDLSNETYLNGTENFATKLTVTKQILNIIPDTISLRFGCEYGKNINGQTEDIEFILYRM